MRLHNYNKFIIKWKFYIKSFCNSWCYKKLWPCNHQMILKIAVKHKTWMVGHLPWQIKRYRSLQKYMHSPTANSLTANSLGISIRRTTGRQKWYIAERPSSHRKLSFMKCSKKITSRESRIPVFKISSMHGHNDATCITELFQQHFPWPWNLHQDWNPNNGDNVWRCLLEAS